MSNAIFYFVIDFCKVSCTPEYDNDTKHVNGAAKIVAATVLADVLIIITSIVVGILGALSVIAIPAALSYTLIALGTAVIALWIANSIYNEGANWAVNSASVKGALGCKLESNNILAQD